MPQMSPLYWTMFPLFMIVMVVLVMITLEGKVENLVSMNSSSMDNSMIEMGW